jgi:hypothetical protein
MRISGAASAAAVLMTALISCSSSPSINSSTSTSSTSQKTSTQATPPSFADGQDRGRPGVSGTVSQIAGSTIILNNQNGQVTVDILPNAVIQKTVAGTAADLQEGQMVTITGSADANGNITASRISIRSRSASFPSFTPPTGTFPNPNMNRPTGKDPGGFNPNGNITFGTIATVSENSMTVTTGQNQQIAVVINSDTFIEETVNGNPSDVQIGVFVSVSGTAEQNGNMQATFITIGSEGQIPAP